mgnify:CR=1 FL=1
MGKITDTQLQEMIQMQDEMNQKVSSDWRNKDWDWDLAAQMELMEGVEHWGYKWWKQQTPDLPQVQLEVVDAFHFWLSGAIASEELLVGHTVDNINRLVDSAHYSNWGVEAKGRVLKVIATDYKELIRHQENWADLLNAVDLTPYDLYIMYIQKNVLNHFRQDNGYKTGEYTKIWLGEEDNVHLLELSHQLTAEGTFSKDNLYTALAERYAEVSS